MKDFAPFVLVAILALILFAWVWHSSSECEERHGVLIRDAAGRYVCLQAVPR